MNTPKYSLKAILTIRWQVGGTFFNMKGMTNHTKAPHLVMKAILYQFSGVVMI
jgi:hypothetical protein